MIGFLNIASPETWEVYVAGFKQGLAQTGFVDVAIEYRWARGQYDRLSGLGRGLGGSQGGGDRGQWRQQVCVGGDR